MTDLTSLTLAEARDRLRRQDITALELTDAHIGAIQAARALNAFVKEPPDHARGGGGAGVGGGESWEWETWLGWGGAAPPPPQEKNPQNNPPPLMIRPLPQT